MEHITIKAKEGKVFKRKHDGFIMGDEIVLGYDYSTGIKREDMPEYYEEIDKPEEEIIPNKEKNQVKNYGNRKF